MLLKPVGFFTKSWYCFTNGANNTILMTLIPFLSTICFAVLLSACAGIKSPEQIPSLNSSAKTNKPTVIKEAFHISGAIAAKGPKQAWTASFYWTQHNRNDYQIVLSGPLGSSSIDITMHQGTLTYREGRKVIHSQQPEALLAKETGVRIPVSYLYDWIRAQPAPVHVDAIARDEHHDIISLKQAGFTLTYSDYRDHYPHKIRLEGQQLLIKIAIKSWH